MIIQEFSKSAQESAATERCMSDRKENGVEFFQAARL